MIVTCPVCPLAILLPVGAAHSQHEEVKQLGLAFHLSRLPPLLVMVTTWPVGLGCPCVLLKLRVSGEAPIIGAAGGGRGCTVNCTMTVWVLWLAIKEIVP